MFTESFQFRPCGFVGRPFFFSFVHLEGRRFSTPMGLAAVVHIIDDTDVIVEGLEAMKHTKTRHYSVEKPEKVQLRSGPSDRCMVC